MLVKEKSYLHAWYQGLEVIRNSEIIEKNYLHLWIQAFQPIKNPSEFSCEREFRTLVVHRVCVFCKHRYKLLKHFNDIHCTLLDVNKWQLKCNARYEYFKLQ